MLVAAMFAAVAVLAYGCNRKNPDQTDPSTEPTNQMTVEGVITTLTSGKNGLANFMLYAEGKEKYLFNIAPGFTYAPSLGDTVSVTVQGEISESAPNQGTAEKISVLKEFPGTPIDIEVYRVDNIDATGVTQALNTNRWIFTKLESYEDFRTYVEENQLTDSIMQNLGTTQIDGLTEEFFASKNLCVFIVNNGNSANTAATGTYLSDGTLYLKIKNNTTDAILNNMVYTAYLAATDKAIEISDGILLTENMLSDNIGQIDTNPDDNETGDPSQQATSPTENGSNNSGNGKGSGQEQ